MNVATAIQRAERLLPGVPVESGPDPRWQAILALGEYVQAEPEAVWPFIRRWGESPCEDLRDAIATCLLEHLLEHHFTTYFPLVEQASLESSFFANTFLRCWKFGQSLEPANALRFDALQQRVGGGES